MGVYDQRVDVRVDKEMKKYLIDIDIDTSAYIRNLIEKDQPGYFKRKKKELRDQIKALDVSEKASQVDTGKVNTVLSKWFESFKQNNRMMTEDYLNWKWIEDRIIPELKPLGCKLNKKEILVIFQDHFRENKVLINVR